ncbi:hypothetical protein [Streptomyces sp. GESEQ-35]|uniref:hypothetical protein n=1 Tax=Streptomyces sp. GESEQ-35 TaxID=2812657 RepID=UPI0035ABAA75
MHHHVVGVDRPFCNPSADLVLRLAHHLDGPLRDRNRPLPAAGCVPRYAERPLDDEARDAVARCFARMSLADITLDEVAIEFSCPADVESAAYCEGSS